MALGESIPALKEWALVCDLLLEGRQAILLRKGGIDEKGFWVEAPAFYLFPTYLHQHRDRLRPEFHPVFDGTLARRPTDAVRISALAEVVETVEITDPSGLATLDDLHPYTPAHIEERLAFRPRKPPVVIVVRAKPLLEPVEIAMTDAFAGCLSWVEPGIGVRAAGEAALPDDDLELIAKRVRAFGR